MYPHDRCVTRTKGEDDATDMGYPALPDGLVRNSAWLWPMLHSAGEKGTLQLAPAGDGRRDAAAVAMAET